VYNQKNPNVVKLNFENFSLSTLRDNLYTGSLLQIEKKIFCPLIMSLKQALQTYLVTEPEFAEHKLSPAQHFLQISKLRQELYSSPTWKKNTFEFFQSLKLPLDEYWIDTPRIRAIVTTKNQSPLAKPAYYIHRDTWYGNSQSQINFWIPLCDISRENGFCFYLDYFDKPIKNNSHLFNYEIWKASGGYQSTNINKFFPTIQEELKSHKIYHVNLPSEGVLIFSSAHLHATNPNTTDKTRFSIDIRIVHKKDFHDKLGAINVDNFSVGLNIQDMWDFSKENF
jgi:hypothetical protein